MSKRKLSKEQLIAIHAKRPYQAVNRDNSQRAQHTYPDTAENRLLWAANPRRVDIDGVDTPTKEGESINKSKTISRVPEEKRQETKKMEQKALLTADNIKSTEKTISSDLNFPYVNVKSSALGGRDRPSLMVTISTQPKEDWRNGYIENSTYARISIDHDGTVEHYSGHGMKMRKFKGRDIETVVKKINSIKIVE